MANSGTASLDFGSHPGKVMASVTVTGETGIDTNSLVEAWMRLVATADHSIDEVSADLIKITAGNISAGVGFTIYGECIAGMAYGLYTINWVWA